MSDDPPAEPRRRTNRWAYMARPGFHPATDDCPKCGVPSRTFYVGGRRVEGAGGPETHHRYRCEHGHIWVLTEPA